MEFLPLEMFEEILQYCSSPDLVNLSCCSWQYYNLTKHTFWSKTKVRFCRCKPIPNFVVENLYLTSQLVLESHTRLNHEHCGKACQNFNEGDEMYLPGKVLSGDSAEQFQKILDACDPSNVDTLSLRNLYGNRTYTALDHFSSVRNLSIYGYHHHQYWECINGMPNLQSLSLYTQDDNKTNMRSLSLSTQDENKTRALIWEDNPILLQEGFQQLLSSNRLTELTISHIGNTIMNWIGLCDGLAELTLLETADASLEPLAALKSLRKIELQTTSKFPISVKPLCALTKLKGFSAVGYSFKGNALEDICLALKSLKRVKFSLSSQHWARSGLFGVDPDNYLDDRHFAAIVELSSLNSLELSECQYLRGQCFEYISKCQSLRELTVSDGVKAFRVGSCKWLQSKFYFLNGMASLRKFVMIGKSEPVSKIIQAMLKKQKKRMGQWKLRVTGEQEGNRKGQGCYTLTR